MPWVNSFFCRWTCSLRLERCWLWNQRFLWLAGWFCQLEAGAIFRPPRWRQSRFDLSLKCAHFTNLDDQKYPESRIQLLFMSLGGQALMRFFGHTVLQAATTIWSCDWGWEFWRSWVSNISAPLASVSESRPQSGKQLAVQRAVDHVKHKNRSWGMLRKRGFCHSCLTSM